MTIGWDVWHTIYTILFHQIQTLTKSMHLNQTRWAQERARTKEGFCSFEEMKMLLCAWQRWEQVKTLTSASGGWTRWWQMADETPRLQQQLEMILCTKGKTAWPQQEPCSLVGWCTDDERRWYEKAQLCTKYRVLVQSFPLNDLLLPYERDNICRTSTVW